VSLLSDEKVPVEVIEGNADVMDRLFPLPPGTEA